MKKIVLKMSELNLRNERYGKLEYASLHVMEGDITSFLGLNYSGKELAVQILLGEIDLDWNKNKVYIDGQKIQRASDLHPLVYHLCADSPGIENWTVAEYISLTEVNWFLSKKVKKRLLKETEQQLEEVGIHIDIQKKMNSLNVLERRMVEVMRAPEIPCTGNFGFLPAVHLWVASHRSELPAGRLPLSCKAPDTG